MSCTELGHSIRMPKQIAGNLAVAESDASPLPSPVGFRTRRHLAGRAKYEFVGVR